METIQASLSPYSFLFNLLEVKSRMKEYLPTDVIVFQCGTCNTDIALNTCGSIILENPIQEGMDNVLDGLIKGLKENHIRETECSLANIEIHPILGDPSNICVTLPASDTVYMRDLSLEGVSYKLSIQIVNSDSKVIFALYTSEKCVEETYSEFIKCNFDILLNAEFDETGSLSEEDLIYDDESVNTFQQLLPRMVGGGRKLREDFNYFCAWCPKEDIKKGKKGRFRELKNYRDHFRKYHHGENGEGIPMTDFIKKLNRCEPTWFCKNCRQHYSIGNQVRHQAICELSSNDSDSDIEDEMKGRKRTRAQNKIKQKDTGIQVDGENPVERIQGILKVKWK